MGQAKAHRSRHQSCQRPPVSARHAGQNRDRGGDRHIGTIGAAVQCDSPTEPIRSASVIDCTVAESTPQLVCRSRARSTGNAISHEYTSRPPDVRASRPTASRTSPQAA